MMHNLLCIFDLVITILHYTGFQEFLGINVIGFIGLNFLFIAITHTESRWHFGEHARISNQPVFVTSVFHYNRVRLWIPRPSTQCFCNLGRPLTCTYLALLMINKEDYQLGTLINQYLSCHMYTLRYLLG